MRHGKSVWKLERPIGHRRALLRHLVTSLVRHERLETTLPKAKALRRFADRMITLGKEGTLHARRRAAAMLLDPAAVQKLFDVLAKRFKDRAGGYTRVIRSGIRRGDSVPMGIVEYLGYELPAEEKKKKEKKEKKEKKVKEVKKAPKVEKEKAKEKEKKKGFFSRLRKGKEEKEKD